MIARVAVIALIMSGCALTVPQQRQLADLDGCADSQDAAYREMRSHAVTVMRQHGLGLAETLTGLETLSRMNTPPGRSSWLSREDSGFLNRNGFLGLYGVGAFTLTRFTALRGCLEDRHG